MDVGSRKSNLYAGAVLTWSMLCALVMRGLTVSCAFGCPHFWLFAPPSTGLPFSCALGYKYFGVQAPALSTLSVS